jgi:uncharacterized protein YggE
MATVTVRGRAAADVEPDRVRLVLAVQAEAVAGDEALALAAERAAAVDTALDAAGRLVLLRRPAAVTLTPVWSDDRQVTGQAARRTVTVEARAAGPLGELLSELAAVPGATVESTEWVVEPGNAVHATLRAAAVRDARARAGDYAGAADLRLGALEWITEPDLRPGEPGWVPQAATFSTAIGGGGPVLELRPEPVAVSTAVDVRFALLA